MGLKLSFQKLYFYTFYLSLSTYIYVTDNDNNLTNN